MPGDNLAADYMQFRRFSEAAGAGDRLLTESGLDAMGQPLPKEQAQAQSVESATTAPMPVKMENQTSSPGIITEAGRAVFGGAVDAVKQMLDASGELAGWIEQKTGIPKGGKGVEALQNLLPEIQKNESTIGGMARGTSQFITGYLTGAKVLGPAAMATKAGPFIAGALSDISAFDPNDPNLSTMLEQLVPSLKDSIVTFLATDPKDSGAENRFKRAIEGAGLGLATNLIFGVVKHWRAARNVKAVEQSFEKAKGQVTPGTAQATEEVLTQGAPGTAAVVQKAERRVIELAEQDRLLEGAVGTRAVTVGELTQAIEKEFLAEELFRTGPEGAKALKRQLSRQDIYNRVRGNPTLQAAYETTLKGHSEEGMTNAIIAAEKESGTLTAVLKTQAQENAKLPAWARAEMERRGLDPKRPLNDVDVGNKSVRDAILSDPTLTEAQKQNVLTTGSVRGILKSQSGEVSPAMISALARGVAGAAIGITQGDTMQDRIQNALMLGGAAAAVKPSAVKKIIDTLRGKFPRETQVIESFDAKPAATMNLTKQATPGRAAPLKKVEVASEGQTKAFLEAHPDAIEVGNKAIKINWAEIGDEKAIDDTIKILTDLNEGTIDVARRGVQTDAKRHQLADMLGMTDDDMLRRRRGQALNGEQEQAFIDLWGAALKELDTLKAAFKAGEPVEAQLRAHLGKTTALTHTVFGARAEAGRSLRVWGQAAQQLSDIGKPLEMIGLAGKGANDVPTAKLVQMLDELPLSAQKATFLRQVTTLGQSAILEAWINGLLTNPVTHAKNIISNAAVIVNGVIERQIAGMMGQEVARGEAGAMVHALSGGWLDALSLARKAFTAGESQHGFSKIDTSHVPAITAENLGLSGPVGRAVDLLGQGVRMPGRFLLAADDFFKAVNYRMELHSQAYRQAFKEGGTDTVISKRMGDLLRDDDFISLAKDAAEGFANYQTFNQSLGKYGNATMGFLNEHPWMRFAVPFLRTPVNIAKYTLERTPLLNLAMNQVRNDIAAGGVKRDMALAKMAYGGMMFVTAGSLAAAGYITGGGPHDPKLRDFKRSSTGWEPDSFKIGDKYYSFKGLEPQSSFFGMAARIVELSGEASDFDIGTAATAATMAFQDTFINKTYMKGVSDVFEAIQSPDKKWETYFERLAGSVVPAGVAQVERMMDPTIREADGVIETIQSRLPGLSSSLEPRLNIWAEPIQLEGAVGPDLVSPFYTSTAKQDPVSDEMIRLDAAPGMPSKWVFGTRPSSGAFAKLDPGEGIRLSPKEYTRFVELAAGHDLKGTNRTLHGALEDMMNSEAYVRQSDVMKKVAAQHVIAKYREAAQQQLISESDDLRDLMKEKIDVRKESRRPALRISP